MIVKTAWLACDVARGFDLLTAHASEWWPASHRPSKREDSVIVMSPEGPFYERAPDGKVTALGAVTSWDRPHRIVLDFYIGSDAEHPTEVTITFAPDGTGTCVTVRHRPTARSGDVWTTRAGVFERSWELVLAAMGAALPHEPEPRP